jgi:hypothetical protein
MNVELEVSLKIRVSDDPPKASPPRPLLAVLLDRIASHPCVVMLLREIMRVQQS